MDNPTDGRIAPDPRPPDRRALLAYGLWLRVALVGVLVVTGGIAVLVEHQSSAASALAASLGGAALAAFAWRRAAAVLARIDPSAPDATAAAPIPNPARRAPAATLGRGRTLTAPQS